MTKSFKKLWGRLLFQDRGIVPTGKFWMVYILFSLLLVGLALTGSSYSFLFLLNGLILGFSLVDLLLSPNPSEIEIERFAEEQMERDVDYHIQLRISNKSNKSFDYQLLDGTPQHFQTVFPVKGRMKGNQEVSTSYRVQAPIRGDFFLEKLYMRFKSRIGLWEKQTTFSLPQNIKVIPDLTETRRILESSQHHLLYEGTKIRKQQTGVGEFAKVRSYAVGDDPRKINWRQTAKLQQVMTNEYEPEHGKYITILIDCGRMMGGELKKGNRLEKSLEAAIAVAAAALSKGDYVSLLAFGKSVTVYIPPAKGMDHLQTILHKVYNVEVEASESNYASLVYYLEGRQKKRSLVLLFSDITTFLQEDSALIYLKQLRKRHFFFLIGIEDEEVVNASRLEHTDIQTVMLKSMAQQQLMTKKAEKANWEKQGLHLVETKEEQLATAAISYYIDILNKGLI
ncbi:hypothetical protein Q75_03070 [Bacillus coahuilensis p1.1.43]|uniref:DUF58 domain-containing protein n=1 Tax=Bacillus coahuilensis p1.1.43 TaxID=1150625 RepID=A0A147KB78_9BACI|nr:DUF58 domain-containing protein [Bacillus coahuilensis]KUP08284.1 hypothetical protein Q75_03070 [Bacillus coahuilensis p1.1.43]